MNLRRTCVLLFSAALLALLSVGARASDNTPVVWVDHEVSLSGKMIGTVLPATDESGQQIPQARLQEIHDALVDGLKQHGVLLPATDQPADGNALTAKVSVISFKTGSAAGRWLGFGAGAAKCTMRVQLLDEHSSVVAEVIDTRVVDTGGFFTIGADSTFHTDLAKALAETLAGLLKADGAHK